MRNYGSNKKMMEMMTRLSNGEKLNVKDVIGDQYEPQGTVIINDTMEFTPLIIEADNQHHFVSRLLTCVGVTPTGGYLVLWNNGIVDDYAFIDARDVRQYAPIKNVEGILVPINLEEEKELLYISKARNNINHNVEVAELLATDLNHDDMYEALETKY